MEIQIIQNKIYEIRGVRVMLDFDLAELYRVETRALKQAVRRNIERFPGDFMFRLSQNEANRLIDMGRSQNVISPDYNIGSSEMFAFTEQGVSMLSSVLRSSAAVQTSIAIMRAFVAMRNYIATTSTVTAEIAELRASIELLRRDGEDKEYYLFFGKMQGMEIQIIQNKIYEIRGVRVMLDFDLAELYQVTTSALNQAVKRNIKRFPEDFTFQLTPDEFANLKSQIVISSWGGVRKMPNAFTEQGLAMLSGLLNSDVAINVNIAIMRAFVTMRHYIATTSTVTAELAEIRAKLELLERNDEDTVEAVNDLSEDVRKEIDTIYEAIAALSVKVPELPKPRPRIGYKTGDE